VRDSPQMRRVLAITGALYNLLAERPAVELNAFPRNIERFIVYGLEIPVKRMLPLTIREATQYLCMLRGEAEPTIAPLADRELYGLLHVGPPCNIIFVRDQLSDQARNYVLAHELSHFLADVFAIQQLWLKTLPEQKDAIQQAFAWQKIDAWLELHAFIKGLPARPKTITGRGQTMFPETVEREIQADLFARELIAPWDAVSPLFQSSNKAGVSSLMQEKFGLPRRIAASYAIDLERYLAPPPNAIEELFSTLLAPSDKRSS
jgi:hypothetical protein